MHYYILILVNNNSPLINKENIVQLLQKKNYKYDDDGKMLIGRFGTQITHILVETIPDFHGLLRCTVGQFLRLSSLKIWDLVIPYTELLNSEEDSYGTINAFKAIDSLLKLEAKEKGVELESPFRRIIYMTDQVNGRDNNCEDFCSKYGYTGVCANSNADLLCGLISEIERLVRTRLPALLIDDSEVSSIPPIIEDIEIDNQEMIIR